MTEKLAGYVYILEVADIDLPVCKIGMTTREPISRCAEINKSSTGDFIWSVAYSIAVDDCKALEKLIHLKLLPLRQKKREFFNLPADDAYKAMMSIFDSQHDIVRIDGLAAKAVLDADVHYQPKRNTHSTRRRDALEFSELLQSFCEILGVKGRPFGQLNKPFFGMSDGNEGVQWNIAINSQNNDIRIGVNLEGKMYKNWPISQLIRSELIAPMLPALIAQVPASNDIVMTFWRDAWQVASRPDIKEKYIGGKTFSLDELTPERWQAILTEALGCLDEKSGYQKRSTQSVTVVRKDGTHHPRIMQVSPHLTIWTSLTLGTDIESAVKNKIHELMPIHRWMMNLTEPH